MTNGRKREKTKKVEDMTRTRKGRNEDTRLKHSFWDNLDRSLQISRSGARTNHDPSAFSYFNNFVVWKMQRATNENLNFDVRVYKGKTNLIGLVQGLQSAVLVMQTAKNNHNQLE